MYSFNIITTSNESIHYHIDSGGKLYRWIDGIYYEVIELLTKEDGMKLSTIYAESRGL